jgi:c-di-GMP-related signal transduction protein
MANDPHELGTLAALAATDVDTSLETLEGIVRRDAGLSHKLLRYANSAHVSPLRPIASLRHALTMIGAVAIRRWGLLLALSGLRATLAFERGEFDAAAVHARPEVLADAYRQAIVWSDQLAPATV